MINRWLLGASVSLAVVAVGIVAVGKASPGEMQGQRSSPDIDSRLISAAQAVADALDPHHLDGSNHGWPLNVTRVEAISTTRSVALAAIGTPQAVIGDDRPVVLFQMTGQFALGAYPHPPGSDAPPVATPVS